MNVEKVLDHHPIFFFVVSLLLILTIMRQGQVLIASIYVNFAVDAKTKQE